VNHCEIIEKLCNLYDSHHFIICGDYNLPGVNWTDFNNILNNDNRMSDQINLIKNNFKFLNLTQIIDIPNPRGIFLDLSFTDLPNVKVKSASDVLSNTYEHHLAYSFQFECTSLIKTMEIFETRYCYTDGDYEALNFFLSSVDWGKEFDDLNIE